MKSNRLIIVLLLATFFLLALTGYSAVEAAFYYGNWNTQPTQGNHWWNNNSPNSSKLQWIPDDLWSSANVANMLSQKSSYGREFRIEQEAYNPGNGTNCDRFHVYSYSTQGLPVSYWVVENGCGSSAWKEELKIQLNENSFVANTWYRHTVGYTKSFSGCTGNIGFSGEVNYSFSHNQTTSDSWLGKITYDRCFNRTGSDPAGMVN